MECKRRPQGVDDNAIYVMFMEREVVGNPGIPTLDVLVTVRVSCYDLFSIITGLVHRNNRLSRRSNTFVYYDATGAMQSYSYRSQKTKQGQKSV